MKYFFNAFKSWPNVLYMLGGAVVGLALITFPAYWLAYFGLEVAFLSYAASNKRFRQMVDGKESREEDDMRLMRRKTAIRSAKSLFRNKLSSVEQSVRNIIRNYKNHQQGSRPDSVMLKAIEGVQKLEIAYINYLYNYLKLDELLSAKADDKTLSMEIETMEKQLESANETIRPVIQQKIEMLKKRKDNSLVNKETMQLMQAQVDMLEETFRFMLEESVSIFNPAQISSHVDAAMTQMDIARDTMKELDTLNSFSESLSGYNFNNNRLKH